MSDNASENRETAQHAAARQNGGRSGGHLRTFFMWLLILAGVLTVLYFAVIPRLTEQASRAAYERLAQEQVQATGQPLGVTQEAIGEPDARVQVAIQKRVDTSLQQVEAHLRDHYTLLLAIAGIAMTLVLALFSFLQAAREEKADRHLRFMLGEIKDVRQAAGREHDEARRNQQNTGKELVGIKRELEAACLELERSGQELNGTGANLVGIRKELESARIALNNVRREEDSARERLELARHEHEQARAELVRFSQEFGGHEQQVRQLLESLLREVGERERLLADRHQRLNTELNENERQNRLAMSEMLGVRSELETLVKQAGDLNRQYQAAVTAAPDMSAVVAAPAMPAVAAVPGKPVVTAAAISKPAEPAPAAGKKEFAPVAKVRIEAAPPVAPPPPLPLPAEAAFISHEPTPPPPSPLPPEAVPQSEEAPLDLPEILPDATPVEVLNELPVELSADLQEDVLDLSGDMLAEPVEPEFDPEAIFRETAQMEARLASGEDFQLDAAPVFEPEPDPQPGGLGFGSAPPPVPFESILEEYRNISQDHLDSLMHAGDSMAFTEMGQRYCRGIGVPKDFTRAIELFQRAADMGNPIAQDSLGFLYMQGVGVQRDYHRAFDLYSRAADQGYPLGMVNLGLLYVRGHGTQQSFSRAFEMFKASAEHGNVMGMLNLGVMYEHGDGVPQNYVKAFEMYQKAAELGNAKAQANLADLYEKGNGVAPNQAEASAWLIRAADNGYVDAMLKVARRYLSGIGLPADNLAAYTYCLQYNSFMQKEDPKVTALMTMFVEKLAPEQVFEAQSQAARLWKKINGL